MSWMHYNPHRVDPAQLDAITSGEARVQLRDELMEVVRAAATRKSQQHQLLIGARGAGKTHLLRVVAHRTATTPELDARWRAVVLPEEQGIRGPSELFSAIALRLAAELERKGDPDQRELAQEVRQSVERKRGEEARRVGYAGLRRLSRALDRKILGVVENLDGLFYRGVGGNKSSADTEQWALRTQLQDADFLLLLGAAPTYFGAASDPGAAFHGFFREHVLEALDLDEVLHIAREHLTWVGQHEPGTRGARAQELLTRFEQRKGRLAGLLRITGGLPRFAHLLVDLMIDSEDADAETQLERVLDEQTPYFQGRLDPRLIPPSELETLATIARAEGPLRPSELARRLGQQTGETSVVLERLRDRGLARRSGAYAGAVAWDVSEPLYRVWMAFREGGAQRVSVVALTEMVASLYSLDELMSRATSTSEEEGDLWGRALVRATMPPTEVATPEWEERFVRAEEALAKAEPDSVGRRAALMKFVRSCRFTGRYFLARTVIDELLALSSEDPEDHGWALYQATWLDPRNLELAARALKQARAIGQPALIVKAGGQYMATMAMHGQIEEATSLGRELLQDALQGKVHNDDVSWLADSLGRTLREPVERLRLFNQALVLASPGSVLEANARLSIAWQETELPARLAGLEAALAIYENLGDSQWQGRTLLYISTTHARLGDLRSASRALCDAVDIMLERDAVIAFEPWQALHDFAVWGDREVALLALHEFAACVNYPSLSTEAEPWLLRTTVRMLAERRHPPEVLVELLDTARGDLTRDHGRRAILDPFVLAARLEVEPREAVLMEVDVTLRAIVDDVLKRVVATRNQPPSTAPFWNAAPPKETPSPRPAKRRRSPV